MKFFKTLFGQILWLIINLLVGMFYMRIELGKPSKNQTGILSIFNGLDEFIIVWIGGALGFISFIFLILFEVFFIKRNIKNNQTLIKFLALLIITALVIISHYIIEFKLDWI